MKVHSSDLEPEQLRRLLADQAARDEVSEVRRYFLVRAAVIGAVVWVFTWPIPLLPHTLIWALAAAVVFACGLMWPPRSHAAIRRKPPTPHR